MFQQIWQSIRRMTIRTMVGGTVVVGTLEYTTQLPSQGRASPFYHTLTDDYGTPLVRTLLSAEYAHHVAMMICHYNMSPWYHPSAIEQQLHVSTNLCGLPLANPIGLAAGFDKDGQCIIPLANMGFGIVEIGSVTLQPQPGNPTPRLFRLKEDEGIINRYGFNSVGADTVEQNLKEFRIAQSQGQSQTSSSSSSPPISSSLSWFHTIYRFVYGTSNPANHVLVGVNLGKNKHSTNPIDDYQQLIRQLGPYADYLVLNLSSPNTPGLRDMQTQWDDLRTLLQTCQATRDQVLRDHPDERRFPNVLPILVKLAPDLSLDELQTIAQLFLSVKIDGMILTNTTIQRPPGLISQNKTQEGGLSGRPIRDMSTEVIRTMYRLTDGQIPIIGVGGISDGYDAYQKIQAGASCVQIYTSMIYQGPGLVSKIRHQLAQLMRQHGQRSIDDVIGIEHEEIYTAKQQEQLQQRLEREQGQQKRLSSSLQASTESDGIISYSSTFGQQQQKEQQQALDSFTNHNRQEELREESKPFILVEEGGGKLIMDQEDDENGE